MSYRPALIAERTDPDVPETDRVSVILDSNRPSAMWLAVARTSHVRRRAPEISVVLDQDSVEDDCCSPRGNQVPVVIPARGVVDDVIDVPLALGTARIDQRGVLSVEACGAPISISLVFEAI